MGLFAKNPLAEQISSNDMVRRFFELAANGGIFVKPVTNLPAPKASIKRAILEMLEEVSDDQARAVLIRLYLKLADFQLLSSVEQNRIRDFLLMIGAMWAQHEQISAAQKKDLSVLFGADSVYGAVIDRMQREVNALKAELVKAGHLKQADLAAQAQSDADDANELVRKMGLSMKFNSADFQPLERA